MIRPWERLAAQLVREARARVGLSQRALATRAGIAQSEVARIESGRVQPGLPTLGRLLDAMGVRLDIEARLDDHRLGASTAAELVSAHLGASDEERAFRVCLVLAHDLSRVSARRLHELASVAPAPTGDHRYDAVIAAIVENAARHFGGDPPDWVDEAWRAITDRGEWLVCGAPALRDLAVEQTPEAFARRGVLLLEGELSPV